MKYINNLDMHAEKDDEQWILVCSTARSTTATAKLTAAVKIAGDGVLENAFFYRRRRESVLQNAFFFSFSIYITQMLVTMRLLKCPLLK
jgi:hypothetical protein